MKVWIKRVFIGFLAIFFLALLGVAVFLLTFDPNSYKARVQDEVFQRYQRTLNINGDIALSVFPRIGLTVQDASLSEPGSETIFASIDHARVAVAIWPLLSNRLVVDHIALDGFKAWLKRSPDGELNFQDLVRSSSSQVAVAEATKLLAPPAKKIGIPEAHATGVLPTEPDARTDLQVDIAGLELKNSELHFSDAQEGYQLRFVNVQLNTGRITFDQPFDVSLSGRLKGDNPVTDAQIKGQALLRLDPVKKEYSAQRLNVRLVGAMNPLQAETAALRGNVAYNAVSQHLNASNIDFEVRGRLAGNEPVESLNIELAAPQLKIDPSRLELQVQELSIRGSGRMKAGDATIELDAPQLLISPEKAEGETVAGTVKLDGDSSVLGVALEMNGLSGNALDLKLKELKLNGTLKQDDRLMRVNMSSPARWNAIAEQFGLTAIKGDVKIDSPALGEQGFEFPLIGSVAVDFLKSRLTSDMNAVLNGSPLSFRTRVEQFDQPRVELDLEAEALDFDKLFPVAKPVVTKDGEENIDDDSPDQPDVPENQTKEDAATQAAGSFDMSFLNDMDLTANAKVGLIAGRNFEATDMVLAARAKNGRLDISKLSGKLYGGRLSGNASATASNQFATRLQLSAVKVGPIMRAVTGKDRLTGTGDVAVQLSTQGQTTQALAARLDGDLKVALRDGAIKGVDLPRILSRVSQAMHELSGGSAPDLGTTEDLGQETSFTSLDADLRFDKGVGTLHHLAVQAPLLRITQGSPATLDLASQTMNMVAKVRVVDTLDGQGAEQLAQLRGVTVPVRVSGPFSALNYGVQWQGLGEAAITQVLERGLKGLIEGQPAPDDSGASATGQQQPEDTVKNIGDALKGLLGR